MNPAGAGVMSRKTLVVGRELRGSPCRGKSLVAM
jgi:hypothetical protein